MSQSDNCKTRYPLFLIHGAGFRDFKHISYWGRIAKTFEENGATVYTGQQDAWATVEENAATLKNSLMAVMERDGVEKVNIIAHSKGGLEARYMATALGCAPWIASITTVSTPHGGSQTVEKLMKLPKPIIRFAGFFVDLWFRILGDKNPAFYASCHQFTTSFAAQFNRDVPDVPEIRYKASRQLCAA